MRDLKEIQDEVLEQTKITISDLKKTSSFPVYSVFGISSGISMTDYSISAIFNYESTGSRIAYNDYSGSYYFDQIAKNFILGGNFKKYSKHRIPLNNYFFKPFFNFNSGISLSHITFIDKLTIGDEQLIEKLELREVSSFVEPGFGLSLFISKIKIEPNLSIHIPTYRSGLFLEGNFDVKFEDEDGPIHASWFGVRMGLNITFIF
tara:strand:+ start:44765 stop:45379 length:615 start_codon:yes stop_codon:yes gene_type:complete